jgi:hypothetical protein
MVQWMTLPARQRVAFVCTCPYRGSLRKGGRERTYACEGLGAAVVVLSDAVDAADAGGVHLSTVTHWDSLQDYARQCSHSSGAAHWAASTHYYSLH